MGLLKLISNRISAEWKEIFNKNVDYLNSLEKKIDDKNKTTNSRIDNLILKSGGESPNEVVDARVNNKGENFETLQGRLVFEEEKREQEFADLSKRQIETVEQVNQLNNSVATIIAGSNANLDLYVSSEFGSDKTGDGSEEKPFATIQTAVNQIPLICTQTVTVWIDDGVYLENVNVRNINALQIHFRPKNRVDEDAFRTGADMPVKVRRISFSYCSGYFRVYGLQGVDQANTTNTFYIEHGGYLAVSCVKCAENTKSVTNHAAVKTNGNSKCNIYNSYFENQNTAVHAALTSEINVAYTNNGKLNNVGMLADSGTVRNGLSSTLEFASTRNQALNRALIIDGTKVIT
ncbi:hypothetical protein [Enterococcus hirae]|uniref:hypothetical protein n=1 Tax=Enterococcus hirae TaxID=1354 RepID=UPI0038429401